MVKDEIEDRRHRTLFAEFVEQNQKKEVWIEAYDPFINETVNVMLSPEQAREFAAILVRLADEA